MEACLLNIYKKQYILSYYYYYYYFINLSPNHKNWSVIS